MENPNDSNNIEEMDGYEQESTTCSYCGAISSEIFYCCDNCLASNGDDTEYDDFEEENEDCEMGEIGNRGL